MRMYDVIEKKKTGGHLLDEEIQAFIQGVCDGSIPEYQTSALLMAIYFQGMDSRETTTLTLAMAQSGEMLDLSRFGNLTADKHSTGGIGDKTSLIVMPILASLGLKMAKMSGRGLGFTGGTLDKLESIPGYRVELTDEEFLDQVDRIGLALIGQSRNMTPADKKLYALRDVTATIDSIPLIASSIMSKKLAAGSRHIALDVKTGSGAFMQTLDQAEALARTMVQIGKLSGRDTRADITNMNEPLGYAVGNALEVIEAIKIVRGQEKGKLTDLCLKLSADIVCMVYGWTEEKALAACEEAITSGRAYEKMKAWIAAQGGDVRYVEDPSLFPAASCSAVVKAPRSGFVARLDARKVGYISSVLGAGREKEGDPVDHSAGVVLMKKTGDPVEKDEPAAVLYTNRQEALDKALLAYQDALEISDSAPAPEPLLYTSIT